MAFGGSTGKHGKPIKSKPAKAYKLRPAVPPQKPPSGSSGKATMQLRLIAYAIVGIPAALLLALGVFIAVGNA